MGNPLAVQWLELCSRAWVQSLVRELKSYKPHDMAKKKQMKRMKLVQRNKFFLNKNVVIFYIIKVKVSQLCPTLCDPIDYTVDGILQARILE